MQSAKYWGQWFLGILAAIVVSSLWPYIFLRFLHFISLQLMKLGLPEAKNLQTASVGDMYGALTAVFTLVAFAGVVITLQMQRRDLEHKSIVEFEERKANDVQQVRAEFFQLIKVWQDIVHNTSFGAEKGRQAFHEMSHQLCQRISALGTPREAMTPRQIEAMYHGFFTESASEPLSHYFRLLYNIVNFIHEQAVLSDGEKHGLIRLLRAHLSEPELNLLFWSGLSEYARNFKPLIDDYDLLQNFFFGGVMQEEIANYPKTRERRLKLGLIAAR